MSGRVRTHFFNPVVTMVVQNRKDRTLGKVIEVNNTYGWFKVRYTSGTVREYRMSDDGPHQTVREVTAEEEYRMKVAKADLKLFLENNRITDDWFD